MSVDIYQAIADFILITIIVLGIEAGIQDRIKHKDMTWFAWIGRHWKNRKEKKETNRIAKQEKINQGIKDTIINGR